MEPVNFYHHCLRVINPDTGSKWTQIESAYSGRAYHNLAHLREMLGHYIAQLTNTVPVLQPRSATTPAALLSKKEALWGLALIYHDIVYTASRRDNEAKSADLLVKDLLAIGASEEDSAYCHRLIMVTKSHQLLEGSDRSDALLIDLDLAVLARPADGYGAYAKAVRKEFKIYPNFLYKPGRKKALQHFLEQPVIYHLQESRDKWEAAARENIQREIDSF